jgi:hypothetical protein
LSNVPVGADDCDWQFKSTNRCGIFAPENIFHDDGQIFKFFYINFVKAMDVYDFRFSRITQSSWRYIFWAINSINLFMTYAKINF